MDPMSQVFCLRWNNHRNNLLTVLDNLLQTEAFCDVTLACENASIKCHKMILSACSSYFQTLFMENTCEHPIVFLKDIKIQEIRIILDYMYKGEVNVAQEELPGLLKVAELLKVKGLVEEERERLLNKEGRNAKSGDDGEHTTKLNGDDHHPRTGGNRRVHSDRGDPHREREKRDDRERSRDRDQEAGDNNNRDRDAGRDSKDGPPTPNGNGPARSFMYTPPPGAHNFPMFPGLPNIFQGPHSLFAGRRGAADDGHDDKDEALSPQHTAKRKKVESGSGGSSSSKDGMPTPAATIRCREDLQDEAERERERREHERLFKGLPDGDSLKETSLLPLPPGMDKSGIANYVPNQRLEWKRYKQYTRNDIMSAIEEVKKGMSALQASRKYGVPSRTLYDKVKKMGITTGRQMQRNKSLPQYPPNFPGMSLLGNDYGNMDDRDDSNDNSFGPGDMDGRATMVPPTGLSTLRMLDIIKERTGRVDGDRFGHVNLSSMLSNARSRDLSKLASDSSLSPHSPNDHDRDEDMERGEHDIVDEDERDDERRAGAADSSAGRDERHLSDEVRAQVFADLRRFRSGEQQATSTTTSPPPATTKMSPPAAGSSTSTRSISCEDNLPPRKRKVSQEHHMEASYNGVHEDAAGSPTKSTREGDSASNTPAGSPDKPMNEGEARSSLECRN